MAKKKHVYNKEVTPKKGFTITKDSTKIVWITGCDNYVDIPKKFNEKHVMKLWCEQNCSYPVVYYDDEQNLRSSLTKFRDFVHEESQARIYFFDVDDAAAFKLRWI